MKKLNILLAAALVLGLASCDDKSDLGVMQTNPQLNIMEANGITVKYGDDLAGSTLDLNNFVDKTVNVIELVEAVDLPEGATIEYKMDVSPYADFHDFRTLSVTDGAVSANDWENDILNMIGKSPLPVANYVRFAVYARTANDLVRFGGEDFYYASKEVTVTPVDLKLDIEQKYYLYYGTDDENIGHVEMTHSTRHPYDDPVFSYLFDVTAEQASKGLKWYVASENGKRFGVSDTAEATDMSGNLMVDGAEGIITTAGTLKLEVNMLDLTYAISYAFDYMYTPGPANGWSFENNMLLFTSDYVNYNGYVYVDSEYKLTAQPDWSPINLGEGTPGVLVQDGANIKVAENGLYYIQVNMNEMNFTQTAVTRIGVIGGFNGWAEDVALSHSDDYKTWTGTVEVAEAGEWKFRMNNGWDLDLGGSQTELTQGGANLTFPAAGTYEITLNLGTLPYSCTVVAR